jgi:hypothetical protein
MTNEILFLDRPSSTSEIRIEEKGLTPLDVIPPVSSLPHRREGVVETNFLDDFKSKARFIFPDVEVHFVSVAIIGMMNGFDQVSVEALNLLQVLGPRHGFPLIFITFATGHNFQF